MFQNDFRTAPLSEKGVLAPLTRMKFGHVTVHYFRSNFKDWAGETTAYAYAYADADADADPDPDPDGVSEAALTRQIRDQAKPEHKRGKMLKRRRSLMAVWCE